MAAVSVVSSWTIELNTDELRLVVKALAGRLKEEEYEDAYELSVNISERRARATKLALSQADQLLENIERKKE